MVKLDVEFNDGGLPDQALLNRKRNDNISQEEEETNNECILDGHLIKNEAVRVTISGCPGSEAFQVNTGPGSQSPSKIC